MATTGRRPGHGHAGRGGDRVLLGDADVEEAVRDSALGKRMSPVGPAMAAVMATTSGRATPPRPASACAKASV